MQAIIIPFWNHVRKVASIEKMEHVIARNRADAYQS